MEEKRMRGLYRVEGYRHIHPINDGLGRSTGAGPEGKESYQPCAARPENLAL
jgi:hypothetical protein